MQKSKQTCLKRYGVQYSFQSTNNKQKSVLTKLKKYGPDWKKKQTECLKNYWKNNKLIRHNGDDPVIRAKMVQSWKRTVANKPIQEIIKWRKSIICTKSKIASECLMNISNLLNIDIKREYPILTFHVDGYIENKCIIQFFGNYWHANPIIYNQNDEISFHGIIKTAKQVWEKDNIRLQKIIDFCNLPIIIIWEQSYINNKQIFLQQLKDNFLKGIFKNGQIYYF